MSYKLHLVTHSKACSIFVPRRLQIPPWAPVAFQHAYSTFFFIDASLQITQSHLCVHRYFCSNLLRPQVRKVADPSAAIFQSNRGKTTQMRVMCHQWLSPLQHPLRVQRVKLQVDYVQYSMCLELICTFLTSPTPLSYNTNTSLVTFFCCPLLTVVHNGRFCGRVKDLCERVCSRFTSILTPCTVDCVFQF